MKNLLTIALFALTLVSTASAQSNVSSQQVAINVAQISVIAVQGNINMVIASATAGQAPDAANASATYAVTTNGTDQKISAQLDRTLPTGLSLFATMAAPTKATSNGKVELSSKSADLVTGISSVNQSGLALNYQAVATVAATPDNVVRTVTYTITNN